MTIQEKLEGIQHRRIDLSSPDVFENPTDNDPHRPEIRIWAGLDDDGGQAHVTLGVMALWGQANRFVDLHPDEARRLAWNLIGMANRVDCIVGGVATDSAGLMQQLRDSVALCDAERGPC